MYTSYVLPLWIPFLFFFILTSYLWLTDRRRYAAGRCAECGYDLTGNTSGVCPECGTQTPAT
jgi:ABC-type ATPase with predicted acetyltransferase domain